MGNATCNRQAATSAVAAAAVAAGKAATAAAAATHEVKRAPAEVCVAIRLPRQLRRGPQQKDKPSQSPQPGQASQPASQRAGELVSKSSRSSVAAAQRICPDAQLARDSRPKTTSKQSYRNRHIFCLGHRSYTVGKSNRSVKV